MVTETAVRELPTVRYELRELLGRGAMGEVWRAVDRLLGRPVAVKLMRAQDDEAEAERFRLEARTTASLSHPNIVGAYDFGSHLGQLYLVMEFVDGHSLAQERRLRGVLDWPEAIALAAQAAGGLAAAHRRGVIHRDVKPANLMVTADRTVKITDFGIARFAGQAASALTATGKILGTADYLAPERVQGRPAEPASDVYSLGCVLYELLTGRPPFSGATALDVVQQHVGAAPPPPVRLRTGLPRPLSAYVLHMLAKDPADRPTATQAAGWLTAFPSRPPV
jgi:serine/threonine-protein kinase